MKKSLLLLSVLLFAIGVYAQDKVIIAHKMQRYIGDVTELDRTLYFNFHSNDNTDPDIVAFKNEYGITYGRGFWGAFSTAKQKTGSVGVYPSYTSGTTDNTVRSVRKFIATEHPENVARWDVPVQDAANWAVEYYLDYIQDNDRPEFFEPMNEPFVHAGDAVFAEQQPNDQLMRERMADWFGAIGEKFHSTPELANMKVVGYSSAWPSMELWDFGHWNTRMKMFMDRAGEHIDAFATHLYDGINITGADSKRSGSNSEAILDLIETYSFTKWGVIKPHAITEFGGIEKGYGDAYSDVKSIQTVKSLNHILFNLLERQNNLAVSIPFIGDKAKWHLTAQYNYQPYGSVLWRPEVMGVPVDANTKWVFTPRIYFFDLWKDVQGKRVYYQCENPDIQTQAYVKDNKLYVALSNLDDVDRDLSMEFFDGLDGFASVRVKRLKIWGDQDPQYTDETFDTALQQISLIPDETVVLEYTFNNAIEFVNKATSTKYYTSQHLNPISGKQTFNFNGVTGIANGGKAYLRMSIGRKHDKSKRPSVYVNGTKIPAPNNWAGYDQANRDDFFGMINIPVPIQYISENNVVEIEFPDNSGRISSVILQVEAFENPSDVSIGKGQEYGVKVYPAQVKDGWLKVILEQPNVFSNAQLVNMSGEIVKQYNLSLSQTEYLFDGIQVPRGVYILQLTGKNALFTQKIFISK